MVLTVFIINRSTDLLASIMLTGIFSLLSAGFFVLMDAVDVAFTEAAVGAGISTILMLATMSLIGQHYERRPTRHLPLFAVAIVLVTGSLLVYGTMDMPVFGKADTPVQQHVAPRYLNQSMDEIGVPNVVTSVLASYRGFDTFGETVVIFTAGLGVLALLGFRRNKQQESNHAMPAMSSHKILRVIGSLLIPPIMLFALYVQFHGDFGPGGGFQAGVIFAAAIILHSMLFGLSKTRQIFKDRSIYLAAGAGVLLYGGVGVVSMFKGGNFLDYNVLLSDAVSGQHIGILLVELGVGLTVATVMLIVFFNFSARVDHQQEEKS